jgi:hypothetical protein
MKHRALSMLLALVMVVSLLPVAALADGEDLPTEEELPTAADEKSATQLYVDRDSTATSYVRYEKDSVFQLPFLFYLNDADDFVPAKMIQGFMESSTKCYAIQTTGETRQTFGRVEIHPDGENPFILWKDFPTDMNWAEAEEASYVLMFQCNEQWYKLDAQLHAGSAPLAGGLVMQYNGRDYFAGETATLSAGEYEVALMVKDRENTNSITAADRLRVDGEVVKNLHPTNSDGEEITLWQFDLSRPEGTSATGWIQYDNGNNEENKVYIKVMSSHGETVKDTDYDVTTEWEEDENGGRLVFTANGEKYYNNVAEFQWDDNTYYLAACEWRENLFDIAPKSIQGGRGFTQGSNDHMYVAAEAFRLISGTGGRDDTTYSIEETVVSAMKEAGYEFRVLVHPAGGNENYPTSETVSMESQSSDHGKVGLDWTHLYYGDPSTAGSWVYEAQLVKTENGTKTVVARSFSLDTFQRMDRKRMELSGSLDNINDAIAEELACYSEVGEYELPTIEFVLPAGTITGQIIIPETKCFVGLMGAGADEGVISTTIKGGVKLEGADCDFESIHFVGAGKDQKKWSDGSPNAAAYGWGEGLPRNCVLEDYYCAIGSEDRSSWAANRSVFRNNHIGIRMSATGGGNLQMLGNWFVGNDTAVQVDVCDQPSLLESSGNRFVNNGYDMVNNSGKTIWMSQNFFYHDYDATDSEAEWNPILWEQEEVKGEDDETVVILRLKREGENGAILAKGMPAFETTENYNALDADGNPQYLNFLPRFDGSSKTMAYPLARTQECVSFFYPNWRDPNFCPQWWSKNNPYYPSYVQQGVTISENELDGLRFSSYDSETDTAVGTFEFSASAAETEN